MNGIQVKNPDGRQCNWILDAVVTIIRHKKIKIDYYIYIKVISDGKVYYITFYTDNFLNTTNNDKVFPELRRVFEEHFDIKFQERSVLRYLNLKFTSILLVSVLIRQIPSWN